MKLIAFLMFLIPFCVMAGEREAEAYAIARKYCMATAVQPGPMKTLLGVNGAQKLSKDEALAKFGIRMELWVVATKTSDYAVYSMGYGHCGVLSKNLAFREVTKIARKRFGVKAKIQEDKSIYVSTLHGSWYKRQKKKQTIITDIVIEIATAKVGDRKNTTSLDVMLKPVYQYLIKQKQPAALCSADSRSRVKCG
ncbi:hypothetical protein IHQ71_25380 [Rhizobium sp. TH2]|uniref:hypothetical protein n=1 Tax=Rhizobium sp. TH2 TaxID=2775403 RepID=UPI002156FA85|nr:hypothetical protein [Rhizobium sp. TH2]UVC08439.1 hypothetical protein IHQ71_25380 [Rhizobium sp. TH2]